MSPKPRIGAPAGSWTFRTWLLPWLQVALATGQAAAAGAIVPLAASLSILVALPFLKRPVGHARWRGWAVLLACSLWWMVASIGRPGGGLDDLLRIGGWCLVLLAGLQILSLGHGGSPVLVGWCALGATMLFAGQPGRAGYAIVGIQVLLLVESLRGPGSARVGPGFAIRRWVSVLLVAVGLSGGLRKHWLGRWTPSGARQTESVYRIKGFSTVSRLGTFGPDYLAQRRGEAALRVFSDSSPGLLKGMVHDVYSHGNWISLKPSGWHAAERMSLEFSQFCRDIPDATVPRAWAVPADSRVPVLFTPPGTGCVGVVADSLSVGGAGVFRAPVEGVARGWTWYGRQLVDTATAPADLRVPRELAGLLDSVLSGIGSASTNGAASSADQTKIADSIVALLERDFRYDLDVPLVAGEDPLRTFFRVGKGYCEYYATAAVLLLRRAGVPARYVTGFSVPERSSAGSWIYRQDGAHAWAEWKPFDGNWRVLDPTPASGVPSVPPSPFHALTESVAGWTDLVVHRLRDGTWRERLEDRTGFADGWGLERSGLAVVLLGACSMGAVFLRRRRRSSASSRHAWASRLEKAETSLRRQGHVRAPSETVGAFLERLPSTANSGAREELRAYQNFRWKSDGN